MTMSIKLTGMEVLQKELEQAVKLYPELANKRLKRHKYRLKNHVKKMVRENVKTDKHLTEGFYASGPKGDIDELNIEFSAEGKKNPHWHLIEDGHDIIMPFTRNGATRKDGGEKRGYVPGKKILPKARKSYEKTFNKDIEEMTDELLKKAGLA